MLMKLDQNIKRLCNAMLLVAAGMLALMVIMNIWEISCRTLLGKSFRGIQEITIMLFVWSTFLSFPAVSNKGQDIVVTVVRDRLPRMIQGSMIMMANVIAAIFSAGLVLSSLMLINQQVKQRTDMLSINMSLFTLPLTICAFMLMAIYVKSILHWYHKRKLNSIQINKGGMGG
jgi:TRAP-type C4-dicarboxylate transport system permease small subunit